MESDESQRRYMWMTSEGEGPAAGSLHTLNRVPTTKRFHPDDVFGPHEAQADVYERAVQPLIFAIPNGINASVLAYGQTGSGA